MAKHLHRTKGTGSRGPGISVEEAKKFKSRDELREVLPQSTVSFNPNRPRPRRSRRHTTKGRIRRKGGAPAHIKSRFEEAFG